MIHELVHQWWGLGNMFDSEDPADPWSAEGLTVYTTYRIVKELYGADHAQEYYVDQWKREVEDYYLISTSETQSTWPCCPRRSSWPSPTA